MKRMVLGGIAVLLASVPAPVWAQSTPASQNALIISAEEIQTVVSAPGGGDREIKIMDLGRYNLGVAVLRRNATKPGGPIGAINHTRLTEVYYVVSGSGTFVSGGEVTNIRPIPADNELVTTVVGPGNNATLVKPALTRQVKAGDVIIVPAGVYHGFSDVPDHIEYVLVRPDVEKVLPGGYVNPILQK
jgi:cupin